MLVLTGLSRTKASKISKARDVMLETNQGNLSMHQEARHEEVSRWSSGPILMQPPKANRLLGGKVLDVSREDRDRDREPAEAITMTGKIYNERLFLGGKERNNFCCLYAPREPKMRKGTRLANVVFWAKMQKGLAERRGGGGSLVRGEAQGKRDAKFGLGTHTQTETHACIGTGLTRLDLGQQCTQTEPLRLAW